ncbi:hypothetical protein [Paracoccus aminophilus]|uniref:hypothetical protein n=1 Tax=Paracoccus aminophilus TaxID=34003 RepID=UPI00041C8B91|nr:hypothetical protein [Paracoccus aminophilus]
MAFTPAQVALLDANRELVECRRLFHVAFASASYRLIEGSTPDTLGGVTWQPAHDWVQAAAIESGGPLEAVPAIYRIGKNPLPLLLAALDNRAEWWGRPIQQYLQLYSGGVPVGPMVSMHRGRIRDVKKVQTAELEYLEIRAESPLDIRNMTPLGEYTDRDQQRRSAGDRGCEFAPSLVGKVIIGWLRG